MFCTHCGVALYEGAASCSACGQRVDADAGAAARGKVAYAGFWLRLVAFLIDQLVLAIPGFLALVIAVAFFGLQLPGPDADLTEIADLTEMPTPRGVFLATEGVLLAINWLYFALMESSSWRGTLGKRALGVAVTDLNGKRITFGRASGRFFGKLLSMMTLGVGYVMAAVTDKKQALHDVLAKCLVVRMP
jgi:uncharacterized RDD family membrane protein YckC